MPTSMTNFPLATITDAIISYIQHLFYDPDITPSEYRWNENDRESRVSIGGTFVINNENPMIAPFVVVERGQFDLQHVALADLKNAESNTFIPKDGIDILNGGVSITVGAGAASEASSIANFLVVCFLADRRGIMRTIGSLRNLQVQSVSPEKAVYRDQAIRRWEVAISLFTSIQLDFNYEEESDYRFSSYSVKAINSTAEYKSDAGIVIAGQGTIQDQSVTFGFTTDSGMQFLRSEFDRGMYYVSFDNEPGDTLYKVSEIIDENTISISRFSENESTIPWVAASSKSGVGYKIYWNSIHLHVASPTAITK